MIDTFRPDARKKVVDLGFADFSAAYAMQERLAAGIAARTDEETLLLMEHAPVYTIGSGGSLTNLLDPTVKVVRVNRGGDVTYHGPGQLVGYPLVNLGIRGGDLHRWLRWLEELVIGVAGRLGVDSGRIPGRTGVWTRTGKLASIGVGVRRWVTMHGFALNVGADVEGFYRINPCGMKGCPVTSLERETGSAVGMEDVKRLVADSFASGLDVNFPLHFEG